MIYSEFINKISHEDFNKWFNQHTLPTHWQGFESEKYELEKNGNQYPFKWLIKELNNFHNLGLEERPYSSSYEHISLFAEKYDFEIIEILKYDKEDFKRLKKHFDKQENKDLIQDWIRYCNRFISEIGIPTAKIRMALTSKKELMLIIGMRAVATYCEKDNKELIGFYLKRNKTYILPDNISETVRYEYSGNDDIDFIEYHTTDIDNIPDEIIFDSIENISSFYSRIKEQKRISWNSEAKTTTRALKYLIYKNSNINSFFNPQAMNQEKFISQLQDYLENLTPNTKVDNWEFANKSEYSLGSVGGRWDNDEFNGYVFNKDKYSFILRPLVNGDRSYIVIEAIHNTRQLANFWLKNQFFKIDKDKVTIKESFSLTVGSKRRKEEVKEAMYKVGFNSNDTICSFDINNPDYNNIINSILEWAIIREKAKEIIKNNTIADEKTDDEIKSLSNSNTPLNQILYGPPGTGKTYLTKKIAVEIIDGIEYDQSNRAKIIERYNTLSAGGQIEFVTFHQSMGYEDFVEGIKPILNDDKDENSISYHIEDGIFKSISTKAKGVSGEKNKDIQTDFLKPRYFKMSLGGKNRMDIHQWCIDSNLIALGWGDNEDYTHLGKINDWNIFKDKFKAEFGYLVEGEGSSKYHITAMYQFQNMKKGDIVLISLGNQVIDAIGVIEGEYEYDENNSFGYHHTRKVRWLSKNMNASPNLFVDKNISQQSIYEFSKQDIKIDFFKSYFAPNKSTTKADNYVLIIDEINRGNVSAIFGELITLLEDDKRKDSKNKETIEVTLPYSKEKFSVPSNLYIIGTMNTADRSVEALDTALRRRFSFNELLPKPEVLKNRLIEKKIDLTKLLDKINKRIALLLDKDHTIGHSYFIDVNSLDDLKEVFKNKVIPLLEEYFYGDFGKIGLVLGGEFVEKLEDKNKIAFADNFEYDDSGALREKNVYQFTRSDQWSIDTFLSIYTKIEKNG